MLPFNWNAPLPLNYIQIENQYIYKTTYVLVRKISEKLLMKIKNDISDHFTLPGYLKGEIPFSQYRKLIVVEMVMFVMQVDVNLRRMSTMC